MPLSSLPSEESDFARHESYERFKSDMTHRFGGELLRNINQLVFILLKPDAVYQRLDTAILGALSKYLEFIDVAQVVSSEQQSENLYKYNLSPLNSKNMSSWWWLNRKVYQLGPMIGVLGMNKPRGRSPRTSFYTCLDDLKGPSNPFDGVPGQLRVDFHGCNMALNLIHISDGPWSTLREYLIYFGANRLGAMLRKLEARPARRGTQEPWLTVENSSRRRLLVDGGATGSVSFVNTMIRAKAQIVSALESRVSHERLGQLWSIYERLYANTRHQGVDQWSELDLYITACREERSIIDSGSVEPSSANLWALLRDLAGTDAYDLSLAGTLVQVFEHHGLWLTEWDRLVAETSMHYLRAPIADRTDLMRSRTRKLAAT